MASDHLLGLLVESAARSLVLGAGVMALVKLMRVKDLRIETAVWTLVLAVALSMPFICLWAPSALAVPVPRLVGWSAPAQAVSHAAVPPAGSAGVISETARLPSLIAAHISQVLWPLYCLVAVIRLGRLALGLALTARIHRRAIPLHADWTGGRDVRVSTEVFGPTCFGGSILLPVDHSEWSTAKLLAVVAHEESHVRRGDFYIQLIASAHRALFWFSPFSWWLQSRLGELAEAASDTAAVQRIHDRAGYAEILLEVSRRARPAPAMVAMAHGPGVARRVTQILSGSAEEPALGAPGWIAIVAAVLALSVVTATVRAAIMPPAPSFLDAGVPAHDAPTLRTAGRPAAAIAAAHYTPVAQRRGRAAKPAPQEAPQTQPDFTYNPRALLDAPSVIVTPAVVLTDTSSRSIADDTGENVSTAGR
jgi:beta-lactamase regulating signal transducer with metallopeptidase domain